MIDPVGVETVTCEPSRIPNSAASSGWIIAVGTLDPPVSVGNPFIHELLLRS
jgi:hypothetical protein